MAGGRDEDHPWPAATRACRRRRRRQGGGERRGATTDGRQRQSHGCRPLAGPARRRQLSRTESKTARMCAAMMGIAEQSNDLFAPPAMTRQADGGWLTHPPHHPDSAISVGDDICC